MWHELVLAGVGGKTIAEAQSNLSYTEFLSWYAYIKKNGPVSIQRRQEELAAWQSVLLSLMNGGKAEFEKLLLYRAVDALPDKDASINDVFTLLQAKAVKSPRKKKAVKTEK